VIRARHLGVTVAIVGVMGLAAVASAQQPRALMTRAVTAFEEGRIADSLVDFDRLATQFPELAPELWQRGIALYYAGRYADCRRQFELHRTVNPNDVENAVWHFLCVARAESPAAARKLLLPVGPDARVPMREVYDLFRGVAMPDAVMRAAGSQPAALFFANLYLGLYFEAVGDPARAAAYLKEAANDRYASAGGYMHMVATVHVSQRNRR
jgi:lipoprotein NlpI